MMAKKAFFGHVKFCVDKMARTILFDYIDDQPPAPPFAEVGILPTED